MVTVADVRRGIRRRGPQHHANRPPVDDGEPVRRFLVATGHVRGDVVRDRRRGAFDANLPLSRVHHRLRRARDFLPDKA